MLFTNPMLKTLEPRKYIFVFLFILLTSILSSCTEKISGIGNQYLRDTISTGLHSYSDTSGFTFRPILKQTVLASTGLSYELTRSSSELLLGSITGDVTSWVALKIPIFPDSVGQILADTLILRMRSPYHYGNPTNQVIDFNVYASIDGSVNDSTKFLSMSNLLPTPVGSFSSMTGADSLVNAVIPLDTGMLSHALRTASLALVLVPKPDMTTIRAFASLENGDNTFSPTLKLFTQKTPTDSVTLFTNPSNDFYVVSEGSPIPPGEFILRGSLAERERIVINIKNIRTQLQLNPLTTINSALLQVRSDPSYRTTSDVPLDTTGPSLAYIPNTSIADSGHAFVGFGTNSTVDTTLYSFQIRSNIENSLRVGDDSLVLELRAGFAFRTIAGSTVDVEDYTIDRWMIFGMNYTDPAKRPKLILTYSYLK